MKTNPTLNEMQSLLIQIHSAESNKRAAEMYAKQHNLTGERLQDIEADIKNFTNLANNLKAKYNELLSTLKPYEENKGTTIIIEGKEFIDAIAKHGHESDNEMVRETAKEIIRQKRARLTEIFIEVETLEKQMEFIGRFLEYCSCWISEACTGDNVDLAEIDYEVKEKEYKAIETKVRELRNEASSIRELLHKD